jgi:hypothetical protein
MKKRSAINRLKCALAALGILVINISVVIELSAGDPTPTPEPTINVNLKICIKDESNKPVVASGKLPLTIIGGKSPLNIPVNKADGCGLVTRDTPFKASKRYVILAATQGDNGVKMTTVYFDPSSYAINPEARDAAPQYIEIITKDGVSIIDKSGKQILYNRLSATPPPIPAANGTNISADVNNPNTGNISADVNNSNSGNNSTDNSLTGNNSGTQNGNANSSSNAADGSFLLTLTGIISFLSLLGISAILIRLFSAQPVAEQKVGDVLKIDLRGFKSEMKQTITETINSLPPPSIDVPEMLNRLKEIIAEESENRGTRIQTVTESDSAPLDTRKPAAVISRPLVTVSRQERQIRDAMTNYRNLISGSGANYIELQPTGETSPEYMVGQQSVRLHEQRGGKYVAFPVDDQPNEAWVFPAVNLRFTENSFSLIFPQLTKEDYEEGNVTPRKAVKQNNADTWLIL